jgi:hypothetical protein
MTSDQTETPDWMRQLLAELASTGELAVPLQPLLAARLRAMGPQQLFDGIRLLLETGRVELVQREGQTWLALSSGAHDAAPPRPCVASQGDLADVAAAIGRANACRSAGPECHSAERAAKAERRRPILQVSRGGHGWGRDFLSIH